MAFVRKAVSWFVDSGRPLDDSTESEEVSESQILKIPPLDRAVELGCLYDDRANRFLNGVTLCQPPEQSTQMPITYKTVSCNARVESEMNFSDRADLLNIHNGLRFGILCDSIGLEGMNAFLGDAKTSTDSECLTLVYEIVVDKELRLESDIEYAKHVSHEAATHVVTGMRLCARAFLVFERDRQVTGDDTQASKAFRVQLEKLRNRLTGNSESECAEPETAWNEQIKCRYYGDFKLERQPSSLKEAFDFINGFEGENAQRQIHVHLTPLSQLGGNSSIIPLSDECFDEIGKFFESINTMINSTEAKIAEFKAVNFSVLIQELVEFLKLLKTYKSCSTKQLNTSSQAEAEIMQYLSLQERETPFSPSHLFAWLKNKEREFTALEQSLEILTQTGTQTLTDLSQKDQLAQQAGAKLLIEVNIPTSQFPKECRNFLDSNSVPSSISTASWIDSKQYGDFKKSLSELSSFLSVNNFTASAVLFGCTASRDLGIEIKLSCLKESTWVPVLIPKPPTGLKCSSVESSCAMFSWTPVSEPKHVEYKIEVVKKCENKAFPNQRESTRTNSLRVSALFSRTLYQAQVSTLTEYGESEPSIRIEFETAPAIPCSEFVRRTTCKQKPLQAQPGEQFRGNVYQLIKNKISLKEPCKCVFECTCPTSFEVGENRQSSKPPKFMLIVGETGTGKSTFINGIANAFYRVRYSDNFRFKLIAEPEGQAKGAAANQAHSQTSVVAVYTLFPVDTGGTEGGCRSAMDCPLTLIDTPGFGDTRGLAEDERIVKKIAKVLGEDGASIPGMNGILHGIGFVVKASQNRLTMPQKYIFDQALSLFGKDVEQIILPVLTFADSNEPQALAALKEGNVPHQRFLKFNNGMLYADNSDVGSLPGGAGMSASDAKERKVLEIKQKANLLDWDQGELNYLELFEVLEKMKDGASLLTTQGVLRGRRTLELCTEGMRQNVRQGIAKLTQLEESLNLIDSLDVIIKDADMKKTRKIKVPKVRKQKVTHGRYVTLCMTCSKTCHQKCVYKDDAEKMKCASMNEAGFCTVCSGLCIWSQHCNRDYFFEDYEEEETVTVKEIVERYQINCQDRNAKQKLVKRMVEEFLTIENDLSYNLVTAHKCLQELEKMALRQYPLSMVGYVDNLIKAQQLEKSPGWEVRVRRLQDARESAKIISDAREGQDPLKDSNKKQIMDRCFELINLEKGKNPGQSTWKQMKGIFKSKLGNVLPGRQN